MKKAILASIIDKAKDHIVSEYADNVVNHIQSDEFKEELTYLLFLKRKNRYFLRSVLT
jgi:hypothetical protein